MQILVLLLACLAKAAVVCGQTYYLGGGIELATRGRRRSNDLAALSTVEECPTGGGPCTTLAGQLNVGRTYFGMVSVGGKLLAFGGYNTQNGNANTPADVFMDVSIEAYDFGAQRWDIVKQIGILRAGFGVAVVDGGASVLAIGGVLGVPGSGGTGGYINEGSKTMDILNTQTYEIVTGVGAMKTGRGFFATALIGDSTVYVIGGETAVTGDDDGSSGALALSGVEILNVATMQWQDGPSLNQARGASVCGVVGGKIFVVGGAATWGILDSVEMLDTLATGAVWTTLAATAPRTVILAAGGVFGGKLLYAGGTTDFVNRGIVGDVVAFDPTSMTFTASYGSLVTARVGHAVAVGVGGQIVVGTRVSRRGCATRQQGRRRRRRV